MSKTTPSEVSIWTSTITRDYASIREVPLPHSPSITTSTTHCVDIASDTHHSIFYTNNSYTIVIGTVAPEEYVVPFNVKYSSSIFR